MSLSFPTGHKDMRFALGSPGHARPCQCERGPLLDSRDPGRCVNCGKHTKATIQQTWRERAETVAARGRQRKAGRAAA